MWAEVLKPLWGQKFRDMRAFLQNCPQDYDDDVELQTDQLAGRLMIQQAKTVASSWECVGEQTFREVCKSHCREVRKSHSNLHGSLNGKNT
jgi:hypothetical protein